MEPFYSSSQGFDDTGDESMEWADLEPVQQLASNQGTTAPCENEENLSTYRDSTSRGNVLY